jgi:hypothetical protein
MFHMPRNPWQAAFGSGMVTFPYMEMWYSHTVFEIAKTAASAALTP